MKSTVKIDYAISAGRAIPLIKIIRPSENLQISQSDDADPKDKLINDFLQSPSNVSRNRFFELGTYGRLDESKPDVTTIEPIENEQLFNRFRVIILNRVCSASGVTSVTPSEKINEFFDWLENSCQFQGD